MKAQGCAIIIITHKLKETMEIADRVSVLRQGKMIESGVPVAGTTMNELAQMMVGRDVVLRIPTTDLPAEHRAGIPYGTEINFAFRPDLIHLFDPETEVRHEVA